MNFTEAGHPAPKYCNNRRLSGLSVCAPVTSAQESLASITGIAALSELSKLDSDRPGTQKWSSPEGTSPADSTVRKTATAATPADGKSAITDALRTSEASGNREKIYYRGAMVEVAPVRAAIMDDADGGGDDSIPVQEPGTILMTGGSLVILAWYLRRTEKKLRRRQEEKEHPGRHRVRLTRQEASPAYQSEIPITTRLRWRPAKPADL